MFNKEELVQLDAFLSNINLMFFVRDVKSADKRLLYLSDAYEEIWGLPKQKLLDKPTAFIDSVHPEDREAVVLGYKKFLEGNVEYEKEFRIIKPNADIRWVQAKTFAIKNEEEQIYRIVGIAEDITERKEFEFQIKQLNNVQDNIIKMLAHDLKSPISGLKFIAGLIEGEYEQNKFKDVVLHNQQIITSCDEALKLMDDLLSHVNISSKGIQLSKTTLLLEQEIQNICKRFEDRIMQKKIKVHLPDGNTYVELDQLRFHQIMSNLISNAIKFNNENGVIDIKVQSTEEHVTIYMSDNGVGIPRYLRTKVFDLFTEAAREGTYGEKSTGLGMSITKDLIELHNGTIELLEREGAGVTFCITFPNSKDE